MKNYFLIVLVSLSFLNYNVTNLAKEFNTLNIAYNDYNIISNNKREYNYLYYSNSNNYVVKNQDDIKKSIYNGLNEGKEQIILFCSYDNNDDCINDFYYIYKNKALMNVINNYVSPYNRYSSTKYRININNSNTKIELKINKKYTENKIIEINKVIDNYLSKFDLDSMNTEEKIKLSHDFIVDNNTYDSEILDDKDSNIYNAYGAILDNKSLCQGYAEAMAVLLDRFNIPNIMISNNKHIWNIVNLDGKWLHIDTTWDDPVLASGNQIKIYEYYLVTSDELLNLDSSGMHDFNSTYYLELL